MANLSMLWVKPTDAGTYSGGSWVSTLPLVNLKTNDVQQVARTTSAAEINTQFKIDCGIAPTRSFSMFAILNHNMTTTAQIRFVVTNSSTDVLAQRIYDSGLLSVWAPTAIFGTLPWGVFPWDGVDASYYPSGTICFHIAPAPSYGRYVFVYVYDSTNPNGYIQIGRFLAGSAWQAADNMSYGASIRIVDPSEAKRTRGGRKIVREMPKYRILDVQLENQDVGAAMGTIFEIQRQIGQSGDLLVVYDYEDNSTVLFRRAFYGSLTDTSPIVQNTFDKYSTRLTIEELI